MTDEKILEDDDEPVGWLYEMCDNPDVYVSPDAAFSWFQKGRYTIPLYRRPSPARKPLTDKEIYEIYRTVAKGSYFEVARAIEKAHGIGEEE